MPLSAAIRRLSAQAQATTGIAPQFAANAPDDWDALVAAGDVMRTTGRLTVWNGASNMSIYDPEANMLFRFWHDLGHLQTGLTFSEEDEKLLQYRHHLPAIETAGIDRGSLPWRRYYADTIGQIDHIVAFGVFPENQRAFVDQYILSPADALSRPF